MGDDSQKKEKKEKNEKKEKKKEKKKKTLTPTLERKRERPP
jgi:hypothetical protein